MDDFIEQFHKKAQEVKQNGTKKQREALEAAEVRNTERAEMKRLAAKRKAEKLGKQVAREIQKAIKDNLEAK